MTSGDDRRQGLDVGAGGERRWSTPDDGRRERVRDITEEEAALLEAWSAVVRAILRRREDSG